MLLARSSDKKTGTLSFFFSVVLKVFPSKAIGKVAGSMPMPFASYRAKQNPWPSGSFGGGAPPVTSSFFSRSTRKSHEKSPLPTSPHFLASRSMLRVTTVR